MDYKKGEDAHAGVLYRLTEGMVIEGEAEFQTFGKVCIDGVPLEPARYFIKGLERYSLCQNGEVGAVMFLTRTVKLLKEPGPELPPPKKMVDPVALQVRQALLDLGIAADKVSSVVGPEEEEEEDEFDWDIQVALDEPIGDPYAFEEALRPVENGQDRESDGESVGKSESDTSPPPDAP